MNRSRQTLYNSNEKAVTPVSADSFIHRQQLKIESLQHLLLSQQLLPAVRQMSTAGVWRLLHLATRQCTGAQGTRDNQAAATGDARIHLTSSEASE